MGDEDLLSDDDKSATVRVTCESINTETSETVDTLASARAEHELLPANGKLLPARDWYWNLTGQSSSESRRLSNVARRIGVSALVVLLLTFCLTLAVVGFLGFLWSAGPDNRIWYWIIVRGWATRAVSIPTLVLRTATDLQTGIIAAMLAALALECGPVILEDAAKLSLARATHPRPSDLISPTMRGLWKDSSQGKMIGITACLGFLTLTTLLLQFSSTLLLSDLQLGTLPSLSSQSSYNFDFAYYPSDPVMTLPGGWRWFDNVTNNIQFHSPTWGRNPPAFPAFAEYAEPSIPRENVDDTGVLLRAFLPLSKAADRETVCNYSGNAMILDSRVSCQRPLLRSLVMHSTITRLTNYTGVFIVELSGDFEPSTHTDRLFTPPNNVPFKCAFTIEDQTLSICTVSNAIPADWTGSNRAGGLLSEFSNQTDPEVLRQWLRNQQAYVTWGTPLLIWNISNSYFTANDILNVSSIATAARKLSNYSMAHDQTLRTEVDGIWTRVLTQQGPVNMSVSLCMTAWDTASQELTMASRSTRSEPMLHYQENARQLFAEPDLNLQQGNIPGSVDNHTKRGILTLEKKPSWIPPDTLVRPAQTMPFVQMLSTMNSAFGSGGLTMSGNWSAIWSSSDSFGLRTLVYMNLLCYKNWGDRVPQINMIAPDPTYSYVFSSAYKASGSLARAVASLITTLSQVAYYDQFPAFNSRSFGVQSSYIAVLYPQDQRGLWTVLAVLAVHLMLVVIVTAAFARCKQTPE